MAYTHPDIRFDALRGLAYPYRIAQRLTRAALEQLAADLHLRIDWDSTRFIGLTTAEVTLYK